MYCERLDASFWSEPANALTNAAFFVAAFLVWRLPSKPSGICAISILLIGLGSFAFHTWANRLTALMDVAAIGLYLMIFAYYIPQQWHQYTRRFAIGSMVLLVACIIICSVLVVSLKARIPWLPSGLYLGAWLALLMYVIITQKINPTAARGLWIAVALFPISLLFRQMDSSWCAVTGGTHWLWHILNAVVLWASARGLCQKRI